MNNKRIIIIGGTGALGKTLLKRYSSTNTILIFSRDEHKHVNIQKSSLHNDNVHYIIGDVKDRDSIRNAIDDFKPDIIINKIVDLCGDLPRIELFAREKVNGWDCWGNEV